MQKLTQEHIDNAPKWAIDIRFRHKSYTYTDGKYRAQFLDGCKADSTKVKNWEVVEVLK